MLHEIQQYNYTKMYTVVYAEPVESTFLYWFCR